MDRSFPSHLVEVELVESWLDETLCTSEGRALRARDLIGALQAAGAQVFAAGGAPRDWLCGQRAREVDLCVDRDIDTIHTVLRKAFPRIDPVRFHLERFGMLRWGEARQIDLNILRSHRDIVGDSMWTTHFKARDDLVEDARTRDFTINAFYYDFENATLLDPLHCGLDDLEQRRLRFVAHPKVLASSFRMTLRIVQFMERGYEPCEEVANYLEQWADRDVLGMGEERLVRWIGSRFADGKLDIASFEQRLRRALQSEEARSLLERAVEQMRSPPC